MRNDWNVSSTRMIQDFFADLKHERSVGTRIAGIDFAKLSPTMLEAEMMWTRGQRQAHTWRPWVNYVPTNHRNHFIICNYCLALSKMAAEPRGQWQVERDGYAHRRYILRYGTHNRRWWIEIPSRYLEKQRVWKREAKAKLIRPKIDFLREIVYPFETDGLNVKPGDLVHCLLCAYSILVEQMNEKRRLSKIREIDFLRDTRNLFAKLRHAYLRGELEKAWQQEQDELYEDCFPEVKRDSYGAD